MNILPASAMASTDFTQPPLDASAAKRWQTVLARQAKTGRVPWLHEEVGQRMVQRLDWIKSQPTFWVHWRASASGRALHQSVATRYPGAQAHFAPDEYESAQSALHLIADDSRIGYWLGRLRGLGKRALAPALPESAQLLWSNMSLHAEPDPAKCIRQWHSTLAVNGLLMFSCLGPDTALELRPIYQALGWGPPAHPLTDMHDWGDLLIASGFSEPVMDMERIVLSFSSAQRALEELRGLGRNLHPDRFGGLRGRQWRIALHEALAQQRNVHGDVVLSFEIIYGHAVKLAARVSVSSESVIDLDDMRGMLRSTRPHLQPKN